MISPTKGGKAILAKEPHMKLVLAAMFVGAFAMVALSIRAEDEHSMTGVLIDNACGAKQANEEAATKHPVSCAKKPACAASGYQLMVGDKHYKFDDKGNDQAKAYLEKAESTKVVVMGTMDGEMMKVTSIKAAEETK
jgi:hypothetical protein